MSIHKRELKYGIARITHARNSRESGIVGHSHASKTKTVTMATNNQMPMPNHDRPVHARVGITGIRLQDSTRNKKQEVAFTRIILKMSA